MLALSNGSKAQPPNSAPNSPTSAIPVTSERNVRTGSDGDWVLTVNACAAAAEELAVSRKLIDALERENRALNERLETAKRTETLLKELNETRRAENEALRSAVSAKNETIAAKDAALAKQDELIAELKRRKSSPWKRIGDILIGVAVSSILK
ncbi:MAG: hypothetical protein HOP17_09100 [Acidobacteria bacterium]|nr:hypothetical protein [Acidobacteriota bacterium]